MGVGVFVSMRGLDRMRVAVGVTGIRVRAAAHFVVVVGLGLLLAAAVVGGVAAGAASAVQVHQLSASFDGSATPDGAFSGPNGIAIDDASGDVYVADLGHNVVDKFTAAGMYVSQIIGGATPAGFFAFASPGAVAVDNSASTATGRLYVVDAGADVVDEFSSAGAYQGQLTSTPGGAFAGIYGVDVDSAGNAWVYESDGVVDEFDASGTYLTQYTTGYGTSAGFAVDSGDHTYVVRGCGCIQKFDAPTAATPFADLGQLDAGFGNSVAVDRTNDHVYVDDGSRVNIYDSAMAPLNSFGAAELTDGQQGGIGVAANGDAYVANPSDNKVYVYQALDVPDPTVNIDPPSNVTSTHATFSGIVNPQGTDPLSDASWHFEYSTDGGASWNNTPGGHLGTGTSDVSVTEEVATLVPNQDVQVRLVATSLAGARSASAVKLFTTVALAPSVVTQQAQDVAPAHVTLEGLINPQHAATTYYFELGTTTAYGTSMPAAQNADAGSGAEIESVDQQARGLAANTTYHYRLVAHNATGTTAGQDVAFTTTSQPSSAVCANAQYRIGSSADLIDCRAFELVTPPDKNGGDVMTSSQRTRAAADGSAVSFTSRNGFSDVAGTGVATEYMSVRSSDPNPGTSGWSTHGITPPQQPIPYSLLINGVDPGYQGSFSADLSKGVFLSWKPLSPEPSVVNVLSLYLRRDLRSAGGSYSLLSPCPLCDATSTPLPKITFPLGQEPRFAGASDDFGHIIFESTANLTPDASGGDVKLYEALNGQVRIAGILPDGTPAPNSFAGAGTGGGGASPFLTPHVISQDGSRVVFMVHETSCGLTSVFCGQLYLRENGSATVQLNASERAVPDPNLSGPATYWDASVDDSRLFFTTQAALTDDAPINGDQKLYMYDATRPASDQHNLTLLNVDHEPADPSNDVDGVIGVSANGDYVYFAASGQLVAGQPVLGGALGIYLWHHGVVTFVTQFPGASDPDNLNADWSKVVKQASVTPDGRHLVFSSGEPIGPTGYDQGTCHDANVGTGCRELYVYSADTQQLKCASCNPTGAQATTDAFDGTALNRGGSQTTNHLGRVISADGHRVFFTTAEALVPADVNGRPDVYEYDVPTGTPHLLSDGKAPQDAYFMDASMNGDDVFFVTRQQLSPWDHDDNYDVYDARVEGGFPDPPRAPATCGGDVCQGALGSEPGALVPGSVGFQGAGNLKNVPKPKSKPKKPVHCRRGAVRKRVRRKVVCVRRKSKHAHQQAKKAKARTTLAAHHRRAK